MIAAWMLYCVLCALGLSLVAAVVERTLLAGRGPVRFAWVAALVLSVAIPAIAFQAASRAPAPSAAPVGVATASLDSLLAANPAPAAPSARSAATSESRGSPARAWNWRAALARADGPLAAAWLTLSAALIAHFIAGMVALGWMRRWWRRETVRGVDVLVSQNTGPALVGAVAPAIVLPEWTLGLDAAQLDLMLRHEQEHRRARDGQLLTVAQLALVVMPWNVALWWQLVRLRVAVELDCDARVLRHADARSYGDLLLEVARPRRQLLLLGATAFAERASQLERRIRAIARRRGGPSRGARTAVSVLAVGVLTAAWIAPRPPAPSRHAAHRSEPSIVRAPASPTAPSQTAAATRPSAEATDTTHPGSSSRTVAARTADAAPRISDTLPPARLIGDSIIVAARESLTPANVPGPVLRSPMSNGSPSQQPDSVFDDLFAGITLTPEQEAKARSLIEQLEIAQRLQTANMVRALMQAAPLRQAIQSQADSALLLLVTNEGERAMVRSRLSPAVPGGRGRSGGPVLTEVPVAAAPGGGGRSGSPVVAPSVPVVEDVPARAVTRPGGGAAGGGRGGGGSGALVGDPVALMYGKLFAGVAMTPDQEAAARVIIAKMMSDMRAVTPQPAPLIIGRRVAFHQVMMSAESAAAFASLVSNDADRAMLQSRIAIAGQVAPGRQPQSPRQP